MLAVSTSPFNLSTLRKRNVWYSVKDGNWNDPFIWMSNGARKHALPQSGDDVYVEHFVVFNTANSSTTIVNNLFISGKLTAQNTSQILIIYGNLQATGIVDFTGSNIIVDLNGVANSIAAANFIGGNSTINYVRDQDQYIMNILYNNLGVGSTSTNTYTGKKYLINNTTITGNFSISGTGFFEPGNFNFTVGGQTNLNGSSSTYPGTFSCSGSGYLLFVGTFYIGTGGAQTYVNFTGNPTIEFQNGFVLKNDSVPNNFGTGNVNFTTNNQTLTVGSGSNFYTPITNLNLNIVGNITVTYTGSYMIFYGVFNGTSSGSTLNNNGIMLFTNASSHMSTGTFNYNISGSTIGYVFNGSATLPYTNYSKLLIQGSGVKTPLSSATFTDLIIGNTAVQGTPSGVGSSGSYALSSNTSISGNININYGLFECGSYDLTVTGSTNIGGSSCQFSKNGSGQLIFIGLLNCTTGGGQLTLTGNPSIELRGGWYIKRDGVYNLGSGTITFTTNNQTVQSDGFSYPDSSYKLSFSNNVIVSGGITITYTSAMWIMTGILNGSTTGSIFNCQGYLQYQNSSSPMSTGKLYCNQALNYFSYNGSGNQDIAVPVDPTSPGYQNLTLGGSGAKRLLGNISIKENYTLTGSATLDNNGYSLTNP